MNETLETLALAAAVRRKARVAVLTNNNLLVKRSVDAVFPELRPIFGEDFYVSAEFGARKPEPDVYLACLFRLGAAPNAALFIDDSPGTSPAPSAPGCARISTALPRNSNRP